MMFEGISNLPFLKSEDDYLYYGTKMKKEKIDKIYVNDYKTLNDKEIPSYMFYSTSFLSFIKDENIAKEIYGAIR